MILVTGGTGFLGQALIKRITCDEIRVLSRSECIQPPFGVEFIPGDVADECAVKKALKGVSRVYHLAACKHVGLAEQNPARAVQTNVIGTMNLLKHWEGPMTSISTDKAAQVSGVYGATKFLMEKLIWEQRERSRQVIVRYGNVLYSTGSVLTKWQANATKQLTITDPEATRFFWTLDEAVDHIFEAEKVAESGVPYIPKMKAMRMGDVLKAVIDKYGQGYEIRPKVIGLQPGENLHETLDGVTFSNQVEQYTYAEILERI